MLSKLLLHIEGKIIDVTNNQVIEEKPITDIGRIRRQLDGSLIYPNRGEPPELPAGFKRDPGDPFHLIPDLICPNQEQQFRKLSCGKLRPVIYCTYLKQIITEDICLTCPGCPL
jgi:hypothetical protein